MKPLFKIILVVLAIPAILFIAGFVGVLLGIYEPEIETPKEDPQTAIEQVAEQPVQTAPSSETRKIVGSESRRPLTITQSEPLSARQAADWLTANKLLALREGKIQIQAAEFARLDASSAIKLYEALDTESDNNTMQTLRTLVFAGGSHMAADQRAAFTEKVGLVLSPKKGVLSELEWGGFMDMLFLAESTKDPGLNAQINAAIRNYLSDMEEGDLLTAFKLKDVVYIRTVSDGELWDINDYRLGGMEAETLMAMRGKIRSRGVNRKTLRNTLEDMAEEF